MKATNALKKAREAELKEVLDDVQYVASLGGTNSTFPEHLSQETCEALRAKGFRVRLDCGGWADLNYTDVFWGPAPEKKKSFFARLLGGAL